MSFHRVMIAALAALFVTGTASVATAGCGGCRWGGLAPFAYAPAPLYVSGGCGGCGSLAVTYAPPVYAPPAFAPAPPPIAPAPIAVDHWDTGGWSGCGWGGCGGIGCGCGSCGCGRGLLYGLAAAPGPIYVVNQGPEYTGPGIMVPYRTYSPQAGFVAPYDYPYISGPGGYGYGHRYGHRYGYGRGYGYGYRHGYAHPDYRGTAPRYASGERGYVHPHHYGYGPTRYHHRYGHPHRPVGMRNY
jgi:hypothetical protein